MSDNATDNRAAEKPVTIEGVAMLIALMTTIVVLGISVLAVLFAMVVVTVEMFV